MNLMHMWDQALMSVLPSYYNTDATPQTVYRIKRDIVRIMRGQGVVISDMDEHRIKVKFAEAEVNMIIPPHLLTQTLH